MTLAIALLITSCVEPNNQSNKKSKSSKPCVDCSTITSDSNKREPEPASSEDVKEADNFENEDHQDKSEKICENMWIKRVEELMNNLVTKEEIVSSIQSISNTHEFKNVIVQRPLNVDYDQYEIETINKTTGSLNNTEVSNEIVTKEEYTLKNSLLCLTWAHMPYDLDNLEKAVKYGRENNMLEEFYGKNSKVVNVTYENNTYEALYRITIHQNKETGLTEQSIEDWTFVSGPFSGKTIKTITTTNVPFKRVSSHTFNYTFE